MLKRLFSTITMCLTIVSLHAEKPTMISMMQDNKKIYEIEAGHFDNKNSALQLKFKLASALKQPVSIEKNQQSKNYAVKIGPIDNIVTAQKIQKELNQQLSPFLPKPQQNSPLSMILAMADNPKISENAKNDPDSSLLKTPTVTDDQQINNRLLRKLAVESKMQGDTERRTAVYKRVHEDSSTVLTQQFASTVELPKKSNIY